MKPHYLYTHVVSATEARQVEIDREFGCMYVLRGALPPRYGHGYARHSTCMEDAELTIMQLALYLECSDMP